MRSLGFIYSVKLNKEKIMEILLIIVLLYMYISGRWH